MKTPQPVNWRQISITTMAVIAALTLFLMMGFTAWSWLRAGEVYSACANFGEQRDSYAKKMPPITPSKKQGG